MLAGIYVNKDRDVDFAAANKLISALKNSGIDFVIHNSAHIDGQTAYFGDDCKPRPDVLIVLGGDGTILSAVSVAAEKSIPILGINMGNIGFLSSLGKLKIEECAARLSRGEYTLSSRSMLETTVSGKRLLALNEIAFLKKNVGRTVTLTVRVGDAVLSRFKSDGFLVSTPTGSTAYALSCGGPVISPNVKCNLIIPVSGHHMSAKPVVISDDEIVDIYADDPTCVIADGRSEDYVATQITVKKSKVVTTFVIMEETNFYERLHEKLGGNIKEGI